MIELPEPNANGVVIDGRTGRMRHLPKDSRGVVLAVGQHVAFNWSGTIATGIITFVGKAIQIDRDPEFRGRYHASDISRVRNHSAILVLEQAP